MPRRLLLLVNPAAAGGRASARLADLLNTPPLSGLNVEIRRTSAPDEAEKTAREHAADFDAIVAAGGDGTVREVASGILQHEQPRAALGLLPLGTGNDFAKQTGLWPLPHAMAALTAPRERKLDVIEVRTREHGREVIRHALLFAAAGFAPALLRAAGTGVKRWFGQPLSYTVGFFRALLGHRTTRLRVTAEGRVFAGDLFHVCAGNSEWAGGGVMRLSPGARLDDGQLELCVIAPLNRLEVLRCFPMLLRGSFPRHPAVAYFPGREMFVDSDPPSALALDGDVAGQTPATFRILPGALRVLAPPADAV